jgi:hypothetical protein
VDKKKHPELQRFGARDGRRIGLTIKSTLPS